MVMEHIRVVDLGDSDDEVAETRNPRISNVTPLQPSSQGFVSGPKPPLSAPPGFSKQATGSQSFWKAGNYDVGTSKRTTFEGHLEHARVHPKFLHSNATSHKWAFGAIAELLDNAVDEICNGATFVKVDRLYNSKDHSPILLFQDDGGGMDPQGIRNCMSLGYSSKKSNTTIGQYGNGFKTSTMRLGADVIVFSRSTRSGRATQSIGLLSYTFLRTTGQDDVIVPMVDFDISNNWAEPIIYSSQDDWSSNLKTIIEWSPYASKQDLMLQFEDVGMHGTKIIIYNLWLNDEGIYELSFDDDDVDIRLRDETSRGGQRLHKREVERQSHISYRLRYSLRAYASILYLRKLTNFSIILRGKLVEQFNIADELKHPNVVSYKPQLAKGSKEVLVETTVGFIKEAPALGVSGFNVYHKNRLIRPFWKVTVEGNSQGNGVVGVVEANFIEPAHDKQDFERSALFLRLENKLKQILLEYWKRHCHLLGLVPPGSSVREKNTFPVQDSVRGAANARDQPTLGLATTLSHNMNRMQPESGSRVNISNNSSPEQSFLGRAAGSAIEATTNNSGSASIDQICEENIELFIRCERHIQRKNELKQTIEKLEEELHQVKGSCAKLASLVEQGKKQQAMKNQNRLF